MIKLFTHTDLDGVGCAIVAKHVFRDVDVTYCDYHNVNSIIEEFIKVTPVNKYEKIFITDISVNEQVAEALHRIYYNCVVLLDHHDTAKWLNKYHWANVVEIESRFGQTRKTSGTSMLFDYCLAHGVTHTLIIELGVFVEIVRRYDTWEWFNVYNSRIPKQLNDLFGVIGRSRFIDRFMRDLSTQFTEAENMILEIRQEEIDRYIYQKEKSMIKGTIRGHRTGIIFADRFQSEMGNEIAKKHTDIDIVVIINPSKSISYRTAKKDIHCGEFAKLFSGGGHPYSAGSEISDITRQLIIGAVFN